MVGILPGKRSLKHLEKGANSNPNSADVKTVQWSTISFIDRPHRVPYNSGATKEAEVPAEQNNKGLGRKG